MNDARLTETLEVLAGERRKDAIRKAAVRIEDLAPLLEIRPRLRAVKAAGAAPTKEEFDAVVADLTDLHNRLVTVAAAIQARIL